ncbi:MAG: hypothetical protein ACREJC_20170 [Tepidisphaeraceae bacterium]
MTEVTQQIDEVRSSAEAMHAAEKETIGTASLGDVVRQGDLYLVCLDDDPKGEETTERQLAPGSTQGSRHVATGRCTIIIADRVEVADAINRLIKGAGILPELVGPVVRCLGDVTITHPEHGDKVLPAKSVWTVVYQRHYADEVRRVLD